MSSCSSLNLKNSLTSDIMKNDPQISTAVSSSTSDAKTYLRVDLMSPFFIIWES